MSRRSLLRFSVFVAGFALAVSSLHAGAQDDSSRGRKFKVPPPSSRIEVTVVRDFNGKPIENAAVIFHPIEGERDKGVMELKSNFDGKAVIDVIPIGDTVRLQVIARGYQTYGQDFDIDQPTMTMEVRMKRPGQQYSIYKRKPEAADSTKNPAPDKSAAPAKNPEPPAGAKSSDQNSQPSPNQPQPNTN